jgi:metallo-beta-lactamase family protein
MSKPKPASLTVLGGARTVTGSRFLIESDGRRVLVDCGIFQGLKELRERNWAPFPVDPSSLDAIVITHAHLDHGGYLPRLVSQGFSGPVYCTTDTANLLSVVLPDSGRLHEEEAEFVNRVGSTKHRPALPLYTESDAYDSLESLHAVDFGASIDVAGAVSIRFDVAGHILGSATLLCEMPDGVKVRISGDLGRPNHPVLLPAQPLGDADFVLVESTYGDRSHRPEDPVERLVALVDRTVARGGVLVIPAFAVDRTEVLLYHLARLSRAGRLPRVPVFVDSPMALAALRVYRSAISEGRADIRPELHGDGDLFEVPMLEENETSEGSKHISSRMEPAIIIAGAGMATGGRVVHHLKRFLPDRRNAVALVGFQAEGTRGRSLLDGAEVLKIHGKYVPVRAEICELPGFSVHADREELVGWLRTATREPETVLVVHGEPTAAESLRRTITSTLDWTAVAPTLGERFTLMRG